MAGDGRLHEFEEKYNGYTVYDNAGEKIGKVDELFVGEDGREEYIGVKMGLLGSNSTLIPMDIVRANERGHAMEVAEARDRVEDAPTYDNDGDLTHEYEDRIRHHFGLERLGSLSGSSYSNDPARDAGGAEGTEPRAEEGREGLTHPEDESGAGEQESRRTRVRRRVTREETEVLEEEDLERRES